METDYKELSVVFERCMTLFYREHRNEIDNLFQDAGDLMVMFLNSREKPALNELSSTFLYSLRPSFYEYLRGLRPMTDLGALFYSLSSSIASLTASVLKYAPGKQRRAFINQELKSAIIRKCKDLLFEFKSLPDIVREWPKFGGWAKVNEILSHHKSTHTEMRTSWTNDLIICAAEDDWDVCFQMVENIRDWLSSDLHKFDEAKNFGTSLHSPLEYDEIMLEFRWWDDELGMDFIGKNYYDGYQCKSGIIKGSVDDISKFVFSNDIMPVLFYKVLYDTPIR